MKLLNKTFACLSLAILMGLLMAAPASAGNLLYDNGPINGTINGWSISNGSQTSDSFILSSDSTLTGARIGLWLYPGDTATSVDWLIGTTQYGQDISSGTSALSNVFQFTNPYHFRALRRNL